jgi:hypothetical protein
LFCNRGATRGKTGFAPGAFAGFPEILTNLRAENLRGKKILRIFTGLARMSPAPILFRSGEAASGNAGFGGVLRGWAFADLPEILTDFRAVNLRGKKSLRDFCEGAA